MPRNETLFNPAVWRGLPESDVVLAQLRDLVALATSMEAPSPSATRSFEVEREEADKTPGIRSARAAVAENGTITLKLELLRATHGLRAAIHPLWCGAVEWSSQGRMLPPETRANGLSSYYVELAIRPDPLSVTRHDALLSQLKALQEAACELHADLPVAVADADLVKRYKRVADKLRPVLPGLLDGIPLPRRLSDWAEETVEKLLCSYCVAVACPTPIGLRLAISALAAAAHEEGLSLGDLLLPAAPPLILAQIVQEAPGIPVVPGRRVRMATNRYDGDEVLGMVEMFTEAQTPVVFTGRYGQLQSVFHGGQGGDSDPLLPAIRHVPDVDLVTLARFSIREAGMRAGGLAQSAETQLSDDLASAMGSLLPGQRERVLPGMATRTVRAFRAGKALPVKKVESCALRAVEADETFSGLADRPRLDRDPEVAGRFKSVFTDPGLLDWFGEHLLGQDEALAELTARLLTESLTRPVHLPVRYCAQGVPGTGKSASALLLAQRLGVPFVNIDTASLPEFSMAATQLLGSGPGFVGSDRAGRLERAARHHRGAVIEVSDLDHARPGVREPLGDLFLQVLQTGEAQAGSGAMFSCANLIFVFTLNLPGGRDEAVGRRTGFGAAPSRKDMRARVKTEMKQLLSTAFIDRVGSPILFSPLGRGSWGTIVERAIVAALDLAGHQMGWQHGGLVIDGAVGETVVAQLGLARTGARVLLEAARARAADAFIQLHRRGPPLPGAVISVGAKPDGNLELTVVEARSEGREL